MADDYGVYEKTIDKGYPSGHAASAAHGQEMPDTHHNIKARMLREKAGEKAKAVRAPDAPAKIAEDK